MKLLLDENLSPRLVERLASLFPVIIHVRDIGLKQGSDIMIWEWAKKNEHSILTTDADFVALSKARGWPPKIIHLEECDFPLRVIEELLRQNAVHISEFVKKRSGGLLTVRRMNSHGGR